MSIQFAVLKQYSSNAPVTLEKSVGNTVDLIMMIIHELQLEKGIINCLEEFWQKTDKLIILSFHFMSNL